MSANPKSNVMTEAEYLALELESDSRHEYVNGEVYAMAGASLNHNRLIARFLSRLDDNIPSDCEALTGEQLVKVERYDAYFYPDVFVTCGGTESTDKNPEAVLNPLLTIEVLSPSTERFDRGAKFRYYRGLPSLREYVLVSQEAPQIEQFYLTDNKVWEFTDTSGLEASIYLKSIDYTLSMADIYQRVTFDE